jgi:hypothetical protein
LSQSLDIKRTWFGLRFPYFVPLLQWKTTYDVES